MMDGLQLIKLALHVFIFTHDFDLISYICLLIINFRTFHITKPSMDGCEGIYAEIHRNNDCKMDTEEKELEQDRR